jgi:hypothetical protein
MRGRREVPVFECVEAAASKMGIGVRDLLETSQCGSFSHFAYGGADECIVVDSLRRAYAPLSSCMHVSQL